MSCQRGTVSKSNNESEAGFWMTRTRKWLSHEIGSIGLDMIHTGLQIHVIIIMANTSYYYLYACMYSLIQCIVYTIKVSLNTTCHDESSRLRRILHLTQCLYNRIAVSFAVLLCFRPYFKASFEKSKLFDHTRNKHHSIDRYTNLQNRSIKIVQSG